MYEYNLEIYEWKNGIVAMERPKYSYYTQSGNLIVRTAYVLQKRVVGLLYSPTAPLDKCAGHYTNDRVCMAEELWLTHIRDRIKNSWDFTCLYDIIHSYTSTKLDPKKK
jgi:hypothetical protein